MDLSQLQKRRSEVAARARVLVSVSGSGWHKDDPWERERIAKGGVSIAEKIVGLLDDDRVYVVGEDAKKVLIGLKCFSDGVAKQKKEALDAGIDLDWSPQERHALSIAKRADSSASGVLTFSTQEWNGMLFALSGTGVHCTLASATYTPEEERT